MKRYVLADQHFTKTPLAKLRASTIETWRSRLPVRSGDATKVATVEVKEIAPGTVNRLLNDLRAALNAAAEKHRRELLAAVVAEIKVGTRALSVSDEARKQLLTDEQTRLLVSSAFGQDDDGDFGRLAVLAAATGARFSQLGALHVGDVQPERGRVMLPASKGPALTWLFAVLRRRVKDGAA